MQKSYKGVKSGGGCEGITVSRRCAAEGASIFGQASLRVVVDGSNDFLYVPKCHQGVYEVPNQILICVWGPHLNVVATSSRRDAVMRESYSLLEMARSTASFCTD